MTDSDDRANARQFKQAIDCMNMHCGTEVFKKDLLIDYGGVHGAIPTCI